MSLCVHVVVTSSKWWRTDFRYGFWFVSLRGKRCAERHSAPFRISMDRCGGMASCCQDSHRACLPFLPAPTVYLPVELSTLSLFIHGLPVASHLRKHIKLMSTHHHWSIHELIRRRNIIWDGLSISLKSGPPSRSSILIGLLSLTSPVEIQYDWNPVSFSLPWVLKDLLVLSPHNYCQTLGFAT